MMRFDDKESCFIDRVDDLCGLYMDCLVGTTNGAIVDCQATCMND